MKSFNTGASSTLSLYRNLLGVFQYFPCVVSPNNCCISTTVLAKFDIFLKPDLFVQEKNIKLVTTGRKIFKVRSVFS